MSWRRRVWQIIEVAESGDGVSRAVDIAILALIFLNVLAVIADSVQAVHEQWGTLFDRFEAFSVAAFTVEYVARLWSCTVDKRFAGSIRGRIRLALKPMSVVDLLAIAPFYLPTLGIDLRTLRVLRMLRIVRVAKLSRYYKPLNQIKNVFRSKKEELVLTVSLGGMLLIVSSCLLYYCENAIQPEAFSSIPATMWWAVATLTTVGYGDLLPVTPLGKFFASVIAVVGIGMFALPTGILGAGFIEEIQKSKEPHETCPHCGGMLRNERMDPTVQTPHD